MNTKLFFAVILAFLGYFFSGWGVYAGLLNNQMTYPDGVKEIIQLPEAEFKIAYMILSCLVWSILMTYLFDKMSVHNWIQGAIQGAILGVLVTLSVGFGVVSQFTHGSIHNTMLDALGSGIASAVAGGLIGWWFGRK
jgi:hypothetical protein